jgi:hypothetical protein
MQKQTTSLNLSSTPNPFAQTSSNQMQQPYQLRVLLPSSSSDASKHHLNPETSSQIVPLSPIEDLKTDEAMDTT